MELKVLGNTLDKEQTKAALENECNNIIIAGAGSGKSLTMVGKIKYLVQNKNIPLENILCITFTNAAALSLEKKIKKELKKDNKVYTFHKLALEILKINHFKYQICDENLLSYLIEEILSSISNTSYFTNYFKNKNYQTSKEFYLYKKNIERFITLFLSNYHDLSIFDKLIKKAKKQDKPTLKIIKKLYEIYLLEKTSQGLIDFDDMIYYATKIVKENGILKPYQYIIIDEYQDTSKIRENLIIEIIKKTKSYITVVGDDFQSIYRFSGCDLSNFLDFTKNFKPAKKLYIRSTYRNSKELIHVAGDFIMKNPRQIKKKLSSKKRIEKPIIICYYENKKKDFKRLINALNIEEFMILGRNNLDIYDYLTEVEIKEYNLTFNTIHKSKGLESENILIINLEDKINSLPSGIKETSILKYVLIHKDIYPYEEERRLFYVALTRTKNYCYLFVPKNNPSIFVTELLKKYPQYIKIWNL